MNCDNVTLEEIRKKYENENTSFRKLEVEFGINYKKLQRIAKSEGWKKFSLPAVKQKTKLNPEYSKIVSKVAKRKINELVAELGDHYSPVDEPLIVIYAMNYQRYLRLEEIVNEEGEVVVSMKTGSTYMNPNFSALQAVTANIAKIGDKLGLSIASRVRLNMSLKKEEKTKSLFDLVEDLESCHDIEI